MTQPEEVHDRRRPVDSPPGRPSSEGWVGLLALFTVATFVEAAFWDQLIVFTPIYLPHLGITDPKEIGTWTGIASVTVSLVGLPFLPFWGALADRYARQPVIVRSFVAHLVAGVVTLLAGNIWIFILGRAIQSLSLGNSGLMMATLAERTPPQRTGFAFAVMGGSTPLGAAVGPFAGGPVVDAWGFQALLLIDTGLMLIIILAMAFGYRDTYTGTSQGSLFGMALHSISICVRSPRLRILFPALAILFAGGTLAGTFITLVVNALYNGTDLGTATGIVVGLAAIGTFVISPIVGALADRVGVWRVLYATSALAVVLWPIPFFTRDIVAFTVAWIVINGVTSGIFALSFSVLSSSTSTETRGRVMAFAFLPGHVGGLLGAALGSLIIASGGSQASVNARLFWLFPAAAALTALGTCILALAHRQPVPPTQPAS